MFTNDFIMTSVNNNLIFIILFSLAFVSIIVALILLRLRPKDDKWKMTVQAKLAEIQNNPKLNLENKILHLDKLLEYCLQNHFDMYGSNMGKILRKKANQFTKTELDNIWFAHKIRNQLAHDIHFSGNVIYLENSINILIRYCKKYAQ
jgi:hypothetical protein